MGIGRCRSPRAEQRAQTAARSLFDDDDAAAGGEELVFMDRAAIGLGAVFLHLGAELNFHRLFEAAMGDFSVAIVTKRQNAALAAVGLDRLPAPR